MIPKGFAKKVTTYFQNEGRLLPWREGRDPYRIWISEIMLQQTRIEAVIPYYHRFLEELPTVFDLAACPEEKLLKLWEGLGYYARARNLKKAAEIVVRTYGGKMPEEAEELIKLPGIGEYTAGAIASIAFGKKAPAVDGNVMRVLSRVLGDESDIAQPSTKKKLTWYLKEIYPEGKEAGDLTEGIMEIGERICIPVGVPLCTVCPLRDLCRARKEKKTDLIPVKSPKKERKIIPMTVFILSCGHKIALRKREEKGLLSGMWEYYNKAKKMRKEEALEHLKKEGFQVKSISPFGKGKHIFTHLEWHMEGFFIDCEEEKEGFVWASVDEIREKFPLPTAFSTFTKKILKEEKR